MVPPEGFEEHPQVSLEWSAELIQSVEQDRLYDAEWQIEKYEFVHGFPVQVTPELRVFVLADKIAGLSDLYQGLKLSVKSETAAIKKKSKRALARTEDLISSLTVSVEGGGKPAFDEDLLWVISGAFPAKKGVYPRDRIAKFISDLEQVQIAMNRKLEQFSEFGPSKNNDNRLKATMRKLVSDLFREAWSFRRQSGRAAQKGVSAGEARFAQQVLRKVTGRWEEIDTLAKGYRTGRTRAGLPRQTHEHPALEYLRAHVAKLQSRNPIG